LINTEPVSSRPTLARIITTGQTKRRNSKLLLLH
jgi:hypothetical protein